jgi:hypothetical protein
MAQRAKRESVPLQGTLYGWAPGGQESEKINRKKIFETEKPRRNPIEKKEIEMVP